MSNLMDRFGGKGNTQNRIVVAANKSEGHAAVDRPYEHLSIDKLLEEINKCAVGNLDSVKRALQAELRIRESEWYRS